MSEANEQRVRIDEDDIVPSYGGGPQRMECKGIKKVDKLERTKTTRDIDST